MAVYLEELRPWKRYYENTDGMKILKKANIVQKKKTTEHTKTERQV